MSVRVAFRSRYVWISCNWLTSTSVVVWLNQQIFCYTCLRPVVMSLCSYPTKGLVRTIAPDHHACILQFHLTSSHALISCILSACMSVTVSSYQDPRILHLHPTINHVCNNCIRPFPMSLTVASNQSHICKLVPYKHACLIHLHRASIHICYSNIQPSVLSVAHATDQRSSNGCYNCTGQVGPYQPAVKMVTNICSMQIPYSGVVLFVLIHYTP